MANATLFEHKLQHQIKMNYAAWKALQDAGVTESTDICLDFFYYASKKEKAEALKSRLMNYGYEVDIQTSGPFFRRIVCIHGKTQSTKINLDTLQDWVEWMATTGFEHDADFDGWGAAVG